MDAECVCRLQPVSSAVMASTFDLWRSRSKSSRLLSPLTPAPPTPGPLSLGMAGVPSLAREAVKHDLTALLSVTRRANSFRLWIGSAGTAGGDPHVGLGAGHPREIVREQGITLRTAVIRAEQNKDYLLQLYRQGRIRALDPAPPLSERTIERSTRIVGMMGVEPLQQALEAGAEFVLAGRCRAIRRCLPPFPLFADSPPDFNDAGQGH